MGNSYLYFIIHSFSFLKPKSYHMFANQFKYIGIFLVSYHLLIKKRAVLELYIWDIVTNCFYEQ